MKNKAFLKDFFELMKENGKDVKTVAKYLNVKTRSMSVAEYIGRYMKGGMNHPVFKEYYDICCEYYLEGMSPDGNTPTEAFAA